MSIAIDTGPLVALLNARDSHHKWAKDVWSEIEPPLVTCEAVLTEACFLVREAAGGADAVLELVSRGIVKPSFRVEPHIDAVRALMTRFASVPMSFADACLVRMAELDARMTIMTLDSDFRVYRKNGRHVVPLLTPVKR